MARVIQSPTAPPVPQQLVVAQCAVNTFRDGMFLEETNKRQVETHHLCVPPHVPMYYNYAGLHSPHINADVIEASACNTARETNNKGVQFPFQLNSTVMSDLDAVRIEVAGHFYTYSNFLGISQGIVSDGEGVKKAPEAMGRIGVAINGMVSLSVSKECLKSASLGDYICFSTSTDPRNGPEAYTFSAGPKGFQGIPMETYEPAG